MSQMDIGEVIMSKLKLIGASTFIFIIISYSIYPKRNYLDLIEVVDHPKIYNGKYVKIRVFANSGFESCVIFPRDPSKTKVPLKYWIWYRDKSMKCGVDENTNKTRKGLAIIEGIFDFEDKGHLGMYEGTIKDAKLTWIK